MDRLVHKLSSIIFLAGWIFLPSMALPANPPAADVAAAPAPPSVPNPEAPKAPKAKSIPKIAPGKTCGDVLGSLGQQLSEAVQDFTATETKNPEHDLNYTGAVQAAAIPPEVKEFLTPRPRTRLEKLKGKVQDRLRGKLQAFLGHPYPSIILDEAPIAAWWAAQAFPSGKPAEADKGDTSHPYDPQEVHDDLMGLYKTVTGFSPKMRALIDDSIDTRLKLDFYRRLATDKKIGLFAINLKNRVPAWVRTPGGRNAKFDTQSAYFGTHLQFMMELHRLEKKVKQLPRDMRDLAQNQAETLKRLEIFRHELIRETSKPEHKGLKLPEAYREFLAQANGLYIDKAGSAFQPGLRPPDWAWRKMHDLEFMNEIRSFFQHDSAVLKKRYSNLEKNTATEKVKKILDYVKTLSPKDKAALGLDDMQETSRWIPFNLRSQGIAALLAILGGTGAGPIAILSKMFVGHQTDRNNCVQQPTEALYLQCAKTYLQNRFPNGYFKTESDFQKAIANDGSITDPKIRAALDDLKKGREQFLYRSSAEASALASEYEWLSQHSGSESMRGSMMTEPDESQFRQAMLGGAGHPGYLESRYGAVYTRPLVRGEAQEALTATTPAQREWALHQLESTITTYPLAKDLREIISQRGAFLKAPSKAMQIQASALKKEFDRAYLPAKKAVPHKSKDDSPPGDDNDDDTQ